MTKALDGVVVLDFSRVLAGPYCTMVLADLGADVIKLERAGAGDDLRQWGPPFMPDGESTYFLSVNRNKRSIALDLKTSSGRDLALSLVRKSDVVIENFRPGVMRKMGLDYETLSQLNPRLIYTSITGYGATGPWTTRRAYAPVVNAESGITKHQGDVRGGQYANDPHSHGDVYTALEAASAILAALYQREQTGVGQYIDVSMAETMLYVNEHAHNQMWTGVEPVGEIRSFQPADYPVLTVADGSMVVVSGHPAERGTFDYFVAAMQQPELLSDPRFSDVATRLEHFDELMDIMKAWAKTVPTSDEIENRLSQYQLATGRLRSVGELADTEWAREREAVVLVSDRGDGSVRIPNSPWHFSGSDTTTQGDAKYRGEDNHAIFSEIAGLSNEEITQLENDGVLLSRGPSKR